MIDLSKPYYFVALWYVYPPTPEHCTEATPRNDWLACLWREPDGKVICKYRWRYYKEPPEEDEKSWYIASSRHGNVEQLTFAVWQIAKLVAMKNHSFIDFVEINGDGEKAESLLVGKEWMQFAGERTAASDRP